MEGDKKVGKERGVVDRGGGRGEIKREMEGERVG